MSHLPAPPKTDDRNQEATIYVGNIDERATEALVWELFLQVGPVVNVFLPKDRISGAHQGILKLYNDVLIFLL
jgi:splicing factor 3B subunit 4